MYNAKVPKVFFIIPMFLIILYNKHLKLIPIKPLAF